MNWILPNHQIIDLVEFDLMKILAPDDGKKLKRVEVLLTQSQEILGMDSTSFARVFGFTDDLLYSEIFVLVRENF